MGMKPEFKKVWVDALRSGEFKQGLGTLKHENGGHCCLGVACVVWQRTLLPEIEIIERAAGSSRITVSFLGQRGRLTTPDSVDEAAGLQMGTAALLTRMNDTRTPFAEIADYIEANL